MHKPCAKCGKVCFVAIDVARDKEAQGFRMYCSLSCYEGGLVTPRSQLAAPPMMVEELQNMCDENARLRAQVAELEAKLARPSWGHEVIK